MYQSARISASGMNLKKHLKLIFNKLSVVTLKSAKMPLFPVIIF